MELVLIIGPSAVGKMTVGRKLSEITQLDLLHNHQTIDLVVETTGDYEFPLINELRQTIVAYYAEQYKEGLIMTFRHNFDAEGSYNHILRLINTASNIVGRNIGQKLRVHVVELYAPQEIRVERNKMRDRIIYKHTKKDVDKSRLDLIKSEENGTYNTSSVDELHKKLEIEKIFGNLSVTYARIDNTAMNPYDLACRIKEDLVIN